MAQDGILAYLMQRGNAAKRNIRGALSDPGGVLSQWAAQAGEDMTTPVQRQALATGIAPMLGSDPELARKMMALALQWGPLLTVWHGSPHKFAPEPGKPLGSFRSDKIGTGEGAQARGYGHYAAESPGVGGAYKESLGLRTRALDIDEPAQSDLIARYAVGRVNDRLRLKTKTAQQAIKEVIADARSVRAKGANDPGYLKMEDGIASYLEKLLDTKPTVKQGYLYKADLADEAIPKMLDWDKPLSEQPELMGLLQQTDGGPAVQSWLKKHASNLPPGSDPNGGVLLEALEKALGPEGAAKYLASLGIPGLRYLDQGSRGAGQGTRNFVVFPGNEELLNILERQ